MLAFLTFKLGEIKIDLFSKCKEELEKRYDETRDSHVRDHIKTQLLVTRIVKIIVKRKFKFPNATKTAQLKNNWVLKIVRNAR